MNSYTFGGNIFVILAGNLNSEKQTRAVHYIQFIQRQGKDNIM